MKTFVISYRRTTGEVDYTGFDDFSAALKLCHKLESENTDADIEIVSLTSESLEMLKQTHRRYFLNEILADQLSLWAQRWLSDNREASGKSFRVDYIPRQVKLVCPVLTRPKLGVVLVEDMSKIRDRSK